MKRFREFFDSEWRLSWPYELFFAVAIGVPTLFLPSITLALIAYLILMGIYIWILLDWGHGQCIEMGVFVLLFSILIAQVFPVFQRVQEIKQRKEHHQITFQKTPKPSQ